MSMATRRALLGMGTAGVLAGCGATVVATGAGRAEQARRPRSAVARQRMHALAERFYAPLRGTDAVVYDELVDAQWRCDPGSLRFGTDRAGLAPAVRCFRSLLGELRLTLDRLSWDGEWLWVDGRASGLAAGPGSGGVPACHGAEATLEFVDLHRVIAGRVSATRHFERPCPRMLQASRNLGARDAGWIEPWLA